MTKHEKNFFSNFFKKNADIKLTDNSEFPSLFALYDSKAQQFMDPFICPNADYARRSVKQLFLNGSKTLITQFPQDFFLYQLGEYNNQTGIITDNIVCLNLCSDFVESTQSSVSADTVEAVATDKVVDLFPVKDEVSDNAEA